MWWAKNTISKLVMGKKQRKKRAVQKLTRFSRYVSAWISLLSLNRSPHCLSNILALWEVEVCAEGDKERAALWKWLSLPHSLAQAQLFPHFQTERRAERGDFYFPGDRDIINYLPFSAASCQRIGQRSTDRISPYPLTHWWAHHSTAVHLAWAVLIILIILLHRACLF